MTEVATAPVGKQIRAALSKAGLNRVDNDVLSKCVALATTHQLNPQQMAECWEAFSLNKKVSELNHHTFQAYRTQLIQDSETSLTTAIQTRKVQRMVTPPAPKRQKKESGTSSVDSVISNISSPKRAKVTLPKYDDRTRAGEVVASYHPENLPPMSKDTVRKSGKCVVSAEGFDTNVEKPYRYMFTTVGERAVALEKHLTKLGKEIIETYGISDGENGIAPLEQVNIPRQDKICCVGRICNEAHEGKLNSTSVVLEGSSALSGGARINVDLSHLKKSKIAYSLFPGQIVAVEGMNPSGRKLVAHRICEGASHKANTSSVGKLREFHHDMQDGEPLKVITACGPFTTSDNMDYLPFVDLMHVILEQAPDVVVLIGPFVDMRQEMVKAGNTTVELEEGVQKTVSYEALFANKITALIDEALSMEEDLHTQFVLVPSVNDATARWVFPQPPLQNRLAKGNSDIRGSEGIEIGTLGLGSGEHSETTRIHCFSNPCTFKVNDVVFGVTSTDVLFHMNIEETNSNLEPGTRMKRIAQHILQQRSYYPLFPPPASLPTNLDLNHMHKWQIPCKPDVLLVPSKLTSFVSPILDSTIVVNPGHLSKRTTGGTYAIMEIHPVKRDTLDQSADDVQLQHALKDRICVEVKRI